jgi:hypothetical protein
MFKLQKSPTFTATATLLVPTDEGQVEQTIDVRFKMLPVDAGELPTDEFLRQVILRIDDVVDDEGEPLPYGPEMLEQMIATPFARVGLVKAYFQAVSGARAGN